MTEAGALPTGIRAADEQDPPASEGADVMDSLNKDRVFEGFPDISDVVFDALGQFFGC